MSKVWPEVKLGEVINQRKEFITIDDTQEYMRCRVQLHAKGIVLRDRITGSEIKTKQQQVCRAGEFLVAEIDAKVGGFGIVPDELEDSIVSSHYFLFTIDSAKLNKKFLDYYSKTPTFREQVNAKGSTNYAAIRPHEVLNYTISLPPIAEQQRIVAKIERLAGKIEEARELRRIITIESAFFSKSAYRKTIGNSPQKDWVSLQEMIVDIENGWSPACQKNPAENASWGILKVGAVSFGYFDPKENKELPPTLQPKPKYEIKPGDFLMSRANTTNLVGACALVKDTPPRLMLCDKIFRFIFHKDNRLNPTYLDYVLKSPALRNQIEVGATGTSPTMKNIAKAKIMQLRIPAPAIQDQIRIVKYLDSLQTKINYIKTIQSQTTAELDALLPSILDKAFKGEL